MRHAPAPFALVLVLALAVPALAQFTPVPDSVYRVVVMHEDWGPGVGYLWGDPGQSRGRMWLETAGGTGTWGFTLYGESTRESTRLGTLVVDRWESFDGGRFVGGYFEEDGNTAYADAANLTAFGSGRLAGWTIQVYGHT